MTSPVDPPTEPDRPGRRILGYLGAVLLVLVTGLGSFLFLSSRQSSGERSLPQIPGVTTPGSTELGPSQTATAQISAVPGGGGAPGPSQGPNPPGNPGPTQPPPAQPPPPPQLTATYSSSPRLLGLTGYRGHVHIANPGTTGANGWQVIITLPSNGSFDGSSGATVQQDHGRLTFAPTSSTRSVPAGGSVDFTFEVAGVLAGQPTGCAIDGRPCA